MEECHRRVGRVGPEYQSSRRGRGEQRRPLRRRVGNMGACPPPLRGRSAVVARNAAYPSGGPKIASHVDFDSTGAWRHHVSMRPSSRSQSAATTALTAGIGELFRVKFLREIPHWWILGRCPPPTDEGEGAMVGSPLDDQYLSEKNLSAVAEKRSRERTASRLACFIHRVRVPVVHADIDCY